MFQDVPARWTSFIYSKQVTLINVHLLICPVLNGSIKVGGEDKVHKQYHTVVLSADANQNGVRIEAMEDNTDVCLVSHAQNI